MEDEKETLFDYLEWTDTTPEQIATECFKALWVKCSDDWERFKEAVNKL